MIKNIIIFGPPGAGKGVQSNIMKPKYNLFHISVGDILRDTTTEIGSRVKDIIDSGNIVSDEISSEIVTNIIKSPECQNGFIIDGFPRTIKQAEILDDFCQKENITIDVIINLKIDDELLISRITGRLIHKPSGRIYNTYLNPPKVEGLDDITGEPLYQRAD